MNNRGRCVTGDELEILRNFFVSFPWNWLIELRHGIEFSRVRLWTHVTQSKNIFFWGFYVMWTRLAVEWITSYKWTECAVISVVRIREFAIVLCDLRENQFSVNYVPYIMTPFIQHAECWLWYHFSHIVFVRVLFNSFVIVFSVHQSPYSPYRAVVGGFVTKS